MVKKLNKELFLESALDSKLSAEQLFALPERIIQFGTGVLLRGLPDYYIDKANKQGLFGGRIVVVKSTSSSGNDEFAAQDNLYTIGVIGYDGDQFIESYHINAAISQVINANTDWDLVLSKAANPDINIVISNTTEKGIEFVEERILATPPISFPAKLLAYIYARYQAIGFQENSSLTVLPTELINHNGEVLKGIVDQLIEYSKLDTNFTNWYKSKVSFHNTLVDRIVPGLPKTEFIQKYEDKIGYQDYCLLIAEPYNLWAIEGGEDLKDKLSFAAIHQGIKITENIDKFKELKLRLLNATHSFTAGYALYHDLFTVSNAMSNEDFNKFILGVTDEIISVLPESISMEERIEFRNAVISRFRNPEIKHYWTSIILNYTDKFQVRCIPLIDNYISQNNKLPKYMMEGLKYFIRLSSPDSTSEGKYFKEVNGQSILLNDPQSADIFQRLQTLDQSAFMQDILQNKLGMKSDHVEQINEVISVSNNLV
jgi:tagaturonate reductase